MKKIEKFLCLVAVLLLLSLKISANTGESHQRDHLSDDIIEHIVSKPVYFGASLTAKTMQRVGIVFDAIAPFVSKELFFPRINNNGGNPSHLAMQQMAEPVINSEIKQNFIHYPAMQDPFFFNLKYDQSLNPFFTPSEYRRSYLSLQSFPSLQELTEEPFQALNFAHATASYEEAQFAYQTYQFIKEDGTLHRFYEESTILLGVDALYWTGIYARNSDCTPDYSYHYVKKFESEHYTGSLTPLIQTQNIPVNVHRTIPELINNTHRDKKVLVLGTVPEEKAEFISIKEEYFPLPDDGYECIRTINTLLKTYCTPEKNCYLIDLHKMVSNLQEVLLDIHGETTDNRFDESGNIVGYDYFEMRVTDGAHLTPIGTQMLANVIKKLIRANPPTGI